jgi:ATP-dependent DNA helicase RecG
MMHPAVRRPAASCPQALTPVYPTRPVCRRPTCARPWLSRALAAGDLSDTLPAGGLCQNGLPPRLWDLRERAHFLHHPTPDVALATLEDRSHPAWQRLKAEELLAQQLSQLQAKRERDACCGAGAARRAAGGLHEQLLAALPFAADGAQRRVGEEIAPTWRAAAHAPPAAGRCGSGKTVVAALAAAMAIDAGWQCALMAPTEILAEQHFRKLIGWLEPLGRAAAWPGSPAARRRKSAREMLALVASGEARWWWAPTR